MRRYQILGWTLEAGNERCRNPLWSGTYGEWLGAQRDAVWIRGMHPAPNVEQSHSLPVDRNFELLFSLCRVKCPTAVAEQSPRSFVMKRHPYEVVTISGKIVNNRDPTARSLRCPLDMIALRLPARDFVCSLTFTHFWVTNS